MKRIKLDSNVAFLVGVKSYGRVVPMNRRAMFVAEQAFLVWYNEEGEMVVQLVKDRNHIDGVAWPKPRFFRDCDFVCDNPEFMLTSSDPMTREIGLQIAKQNASVS